MGNRGSCVSNPNANDIEGNKENDLIGLGVCFCVFLGAGLYLFN